MARGRNRSLVRFIAESYGTATTTTLNSSHGSHPLNDLEKRKILFLCTGNSARSILGEYLLRAMDSRFESHSAGAEPTGKVHPMAIRVLREVHGIDASDAESKSLEAFGDVDFDVLITVCDHARDTCPILPGKAAIQAHWGSEDPARADDDQAEEVFRRVAAEIRGRLERFCALPWERIGQNQLAEQVRRIGMES